jgi:hypothetical protein
MSLLFGFKNVIFSLSFHRMSTWRLRPTEDGSNNDICTLVGCEEDSKACSCAKGGAVIDSCKTDDGTKLIHGSLKQEHKSDKELGCLDEWAASSSFGWASWRRNWLKECRSRGIGYISKVRNVWKRICMFIKSSMSRDKDLISQTI